MRSKSRGSLGADLAEKFSLKWNSARSPHPDRHKNSPNKEELRITERRDEIMDRAVRKNHHRLLRFLSSRTSRPQAWSISVEAVV